MAFFNLKLLLKSKYFRKSIIIKSLYLLPTKITVAHFDEKPVFRPNFALLKGPKWCVKMNQKGPHIADRNCRFCTINVPETQERSEFYAGMEFERWGLDLAEREGQLIFWRRVTFIQVSSSLATQPSRC